MLPMNVVDCRWLGHFGSTWSSSTGSPCSSSEPSTPTYTVNATGSWRAFALLSLQASIWGVVAKAGVVVRWGLVVNKRPQRKSWVTAVHYHAHALYGLGRTARGWTSRRWTRGASCRTSRRLSLETERVGPYTGATVKPHTVNSTVREG